MAGQRLASTSWDRFVPWRSNGRLKFAVQMFRRILGVSRCVASFSGKGTSYCPQPASLAHSIRSDVLPDASGDNPWRNVDAGHLVGRELSPRALAVLGHRNIYIPMRCHRDGIGGGI